MKKLFTFIVAVFAALSASADTKEIDIANSLSSKSPLVAQSDGTFLLDFTGTEEWKGWADLVWLATTVDEVTTGFDATGYSYLVVEFAEPLTYGLKIYVQCLTDYSGPSATVSAGASLVNIELTDAVITDVAQVCAQNTEAGGTAYIKSMYFSTEKAVEDPLTISASSFGTANDDGTYTISAGTSGWAWNGLWYGGVDWSDYTYLVAELAETITDAGQAKVQVQYSSASDTEAYNEAGGDIIIATLDETGKSAVNQVALLGAADFKVKSVYLTNTKPVASEKTISLSNWNLWNNNTSANVPVPVSDEGVATFTCDYDWGYFYNWLGTEDCSDYNYYVVEFSEATTIPVMLGIEYNNDTNGTWYTFDAGTTVACLALSDDYKNSIKQVVLENGDNNKAGGTFSVSSAYFSADEVPTTTAIRSVAVEGAANDGAIYNLAGQQVTSSYKGVVIKNGKKYLNK